MSDDERSGDLSDSWEEDADDIAEDDEGTLEEEEELGAEENELDELQRLEEEQDLSVEELRRRYYGTENGPPPDPEPSTSGAAASSASVGQNRLPTTVSGSSSVPPVVDDDDQPGPSTSSAVKSQRGEHGYFSDDEEDDDDYVPPEPWKKQIRVGADYQVDAPAFRCNATSPCNGASSSPDSQLDSLLWRPSPQCTAEQVESYLREFYSGQPGSPVSKRSRLDASSVDSTASDVLPDINGDSATHPPPPAVLRDDEDALYLLFCCRYDRTAALKRKSTPMAANCPVRTMSAPARPWNDADCGRFEEGLRLHGKNFCAIQREQLPNRRVGELVQFYYVWKKTERHDMFVQRVRFEKRQFALNPDATDFMDHFIGQMDATTGASGGGTSSRATGSGGQMDTPPPLTLMHPEPSHLAGAAGDLNTPASTSLISSDPKYAHGHWHATHFNEWTPPTTSTSAAAVVDNTSVSLPHLDGDTVAKVLQ